MQNSHLTIVRERFYGNLTTANKLDLFTQLVKHIEIKQLRKVADFLALKNEILPLLTLDRAYKSCLSLVKQDNIDALKFLIEECGFKNVVSAMDENNITLLHEACLYGAVNCIKYLLANGADPNKQDTDGQAALHRVIQNPRGAQLISLFNSCKVNPNLKETHGFPPIHFAALLDNLSCIKELIKLGANAKFKVEGETYLELNKSHKRGEIEVVPPALNLTIDIQEKANAQFHLGVLLPKCNQQLFQDIVKIKLENIESVNDKKFIIFSYILGYSSETLSIKKFLNKHLTSGKMSLSSTLQMIFQACALFAWNNQGKSVKELCEFATELLGNHVHGELNTEYYNTIAVFLNKCGYYSESGEMAEKALAILAPTTDNKLRATYLFNLANSQKNRMLHTQSLETIQKAFELDNTDTEIFRFYYKALIHRNDFKQADEICQATSQPKLRDLAKLNTKTISQPIAPEELMAALPAVETNDDKISSNDLMSGNYLQLGDFTQALAMAKQSIIFCEEANKFNILNDNAFMVQKYLALHIACGKFQEALVILEEYTNKYPMEMTASLYIKSQAVVIYLQNNLLEKAEPLLKELQQIPTIDKQLLSGLYTSYAIHCLLNKDYDKATAYFDLVINYAENNELIAFYKAMLLVLKDVSISVESAIKATGSSKYGSEFLEEQGADHEYTEDEDEDLITTYDPALIHAYFQDQKQKAILKLNHEMSDFFEYGKSWMVKGTLYNDVKPINSVFYDEHYAQIHPNLSLDPVMRQRFEQALDKGVCKRENKQNGIKFLNNRIIELKIADDCRLYTTVKYKNPQGNYLILFDKIADHQEIKKLLTTAAPIAVLETGKNEISNKSDKYAGVFFPSDDQSKSATGESAAANSTILNA